MGVFYLFDRVKKITGFKIAGFKITRFIWKGRRITKATAEQKKNVTRRLKKVNLRISKLFISAIW